MNVGQLDYESQIYRRARSELLHEEIALRDQREKVARLRRQLPLDTVAEDYVFHEVTGDLDADGPVVEVHFSELFADRAKPLVIYQYMYGGAQTSPCPSCAMWTDGLDAVVPHLQQRINVAVVATAEIGAWRALGRERGWRNLRLVSSAGTSFKADFKFEDEDADQYPGVSVFAFDADGALKHFYSASAIMREGEYRGIDLLTPVWNIFDLTREGRGEWYPDLAYT